MSFSSVEIEHAGDTRGDPNDRFEIGFEDQFHLTKTPNNEVVLLVYGINTYQETVASRGYERLCRIR